MFPSAVIDITLQASAAEAMAIVEAAKVTLCRTAACCAVTPLVHLVSRRAAAVLYFFRACFCAAAADCMLLTRPLPFASGAHSGAQERSGLADDHHVCRARRIRCPCSRFPFERPFLREREGRVCTPMHFMPHFSFTLAFATPHPGHLYSIGFSALHCAAASACLEVAQLLVGAGADVNSRDM